MKKTLKSILLSLIGLITLSGVAIGFQACGSKEASNSNGATTRTATLKGAIE